MPQVLFVGGPIDGERRELSVEDIARGSYIVPCPMRATELCLNQPPDPFRATFETARYERTAVRMVEGQFNAFTIPAMTPAELVDALIQGYHAPAQTGAGHRRPGPDRQPIRIARQPDYTYIPLRCQPVAVCKNPDPNKAGYIGHHCTKWSAESWEDEQRHYLEREDEIDAGYQINFNGATPAETD
uniref:Uncharacterized protein n=1 Tax=viral metagenome TaxID=1070528 RepID=A0A6H2A014_9ZZZZ